MLYFPTPLAIYLEELGSNGKVSKRLSKKKKLEIYPAAYLAPREDGLSSDWKIFLFIKPQCDFIQQSRPESHI